MRSRQEMMDLGMQFAHSYEQIRLFTLEGSLTNVNIPPDEFQDYDFSYFVTDMEHFKRSDEWIDFFGPRMILQKPEDMELFPAELGNWFSYLMIFEDGTKIDLTLIPLGEVGDYFEQSDGLVEVLLDKDNRIKQPVVASDRQYYIRKPSARSFDDCCNEFWMSATYVAKGLARQEILFAIDMMNNVFRPNLLTMLRWKVGMDTEYTLSIGKSDKFLQQYVTREIWERLLSTYNMVSIPSMWAALDTCVALFRETAHQIAKQYQYSYPAYDAKISPYIDHIRKKSN
ncbi:aminoglycoside 6-adenylyltransferase [Paenibacillus guangzhouensis]|uniref:aminoglycoside 6-adenylyltransferase n=1 Tax=Paenibacillus guangzhouensis TaxID=1473112 RepID=UPI001266D4CD|nr:aminoglycoside 6-adenylyltransferase [Paenibacillus guangzhouensis]